MRSRRHDPHRRERILHACLTVIAEQGLDKTALREVARTANVPLGSVSYHFASRDDLIFEAMEGFAQRMSEQFLDAMSECASTEDAVDAVVAYMTGTIFHEPSDLLLSLTLYTMAAREERYRTLTDAWMTRSQNALRPFFPPHTVARVDAFIEGATLHRALGDNAISADLLRHGIVNLGAS